MADRTSIWKKEIHLRKRSDPAAPTPAATPAEARRSIWKRELHLGGKKRPVEAAAVVSPQPIFEQTPQPIIHVTPQPIFEQPPLWDSTPPDPPLAPREVLPAAPQAPIATERDPAVGATTPEAPSSATQPEGWLGTSRPLPAWDSSEGEDAQFASNRKNATEPEWAAVGEGTLEVDEAEPPSEAKAPYGWTESADEPWDEVMSPTSTTAWAGPHEELEADASHEGASMAAPEPDDGVAKEKTFALPSEAVERPEYDPAATGWRDSVPTTPETPSAGEPKSAPMSAEPGPVSAPAEPTQLSRPATPERRSAETEAPAADRELAIAVPPPAPAEQFESTAPVDWMQGKLEPELETEATSSVEEPNLEWSTPEEAEPLPPASGWEYRLPAVETQTPAEPETPLPDAAPGAQTTALGPKGPTPSLLKREVRLPRLRRRAPKASSVNAPHAHQIKNIVGLRVGSSQLAAAYVHNNGAHELVQIARTPLPRGIVAGGEVRDPEALTSALKKFFSEHKLPRRGIRLGIASNRIGVRILEVPAIDDPRLFENSIRFHAQETLPISVSDAIIDHVVLGAGDGLEPTVRVLLVFAHRELVDRHVQACRRAGLKLEGIDFEAFALLRALGAPRPAEIEPTRAVVAVAIGQERTIFAVSDGRICDFTRVLEWGGGSLDVAIARALNLTPSQAEPLKLAISLDGDAAPSQLTPEQTETARAAIRTELQSLSRELVSSLQFYQARPGSLDIGEIMLSGGGGQLAGLPAELERLVGVPVVAGDPFVRVEVGRKVGRPEESGSLAVAIGLGIED